MRAKDAIKAFADIAGVNINGNNPWDIQVYNQRFYDRLLMDGSLGLGESYMDGWWDCEQLDEFICRLMRVALRLREPLFMLEHPQILRSLPLFLKKSHMAASKASDELRNVSYHYDLGNDLFEAMLDKRMVYSCGYWRNASSLDEAQEAKLDLICRKIHLQPGMRVLDIGCGWGSFLKYASEHYGIQGVGITLAENQVELARKLCAGLPIEIRLQNYRDLAEKFDRIVSVGMFEHVRPENYSTYMTLVAKCLTQDGLTLLHTIGSRGRFNSGQSWHEKYIFPGGMLPLRKEIAKAAFPFLKILDWHVFGEEGEVRPHDYYRTLMVWYNNFKRNWTKISENYQDKAEGKFYRMWKYYLLSCAGSFRAGASPLWQIVLSKCEYPRIYTPVR